MVEQPVLEGWAEAAADPCQPALFAATEAHRRGLPPWPFLNRPTPAPLADRSPASREADDP